MLGKFYDAAGHYASDLVFFRAVGRSKRYSPLVKLFRNGELVAEKRLNQKHGKELTLDPVLDYAPGKLTAVAYDENGAPKARDSVRPFGDTAQLKLTAENSVFRANGTDPCLFTLTLAARTVYLSQTQTTEPP